MSTQGDVLRTMFPNPYPTKTNPATGQPSRLGILIDGAGTVLDQVDPEQINLAGQFSATAGSGSSLDDLGKDLRLPRNQGESDSSYRKRLITKQSLFTGGLTPQSMITAVSIIVGTDPQYVERGGLNNMRFPVTFPLQFTAASTTDAFTIDLTIRNPSGNTYNKGAVIEAVKHSKRRIATVVVHWDDGTETSVS